jgi:hypothetical protein
MINLLYVGPQIYDAISFYRGWGPITALSKLWPVLNVEYCTEINWATLRKCDILLVQRPSVSSYVQIIEMAKLNGKKVWIDYDDDLFNVPRDNPAFKVYDAKETRANVERALTIADLVTVSTTALQKLYGRYNGVHVVPNAYDKRLFPYRNTIPPRDNVILWRGSRTHDQDLFEIVDDIIQIGKAYPEYKWVFVGEPSALVLNRLEKEHIRFEEIPVLDPIAYFRRIYDLRPMIQIVPLVDNLFNRAKSNIAWIEATHAGAICVAKDLPEFNLPGCQKYRNDGFAGTVHSMMSKTSYLVEESWEHIERHLLLDTVNTLRKRLIESLL